MTETPRATVVPELLERRSADTPDGVALAVDRGGRLTFHEWEARSRRVAHTLCAAGVQRGHRVALLFGPMQWVEYAVAYLGVIRTGATAVHLYDGMERVEVDRRLTECQVSRVVHADGRSAPEGFAGPATALSALESGADGPLEVRADPADPCDVFYTSGTTGPAKGYTVPHGNVTFGRDPAAFKAFTSGGVLLVPQETGTSTSVQCLHAALVSPVSSLICAPADVERMGELVQELSIGSLALTPWLAIQLIEADIPRKYDLSSVRMLACASAPLPPAVARTLLALVPGARIATAFSQSEASPALIIGTFDPARPLAVGRPNPATELRLAGPDGEPVPPGEVGEIWLRHCAPRRLYLDPARNEGILADGWYRTNDYGRLTEDGELVLFDRGEDLVRTAAGPVSTIEVEAALYEHPAVREAGVVGVPAGDGVPEIVAAVALRTPADPADLREFAAQRLRPYQVPARVVVVDALPRSGKGKVLKSELRELVAEAAVAWR